MARPVKPGLDYFPFDVDFSDSKKVGAIMGEFGNKGVLTMVYVLSSIYKEGYYLSWDKLIKMQLVNKIQGMTSNEIDEIVDRLVEYKMFDETIYKTAQVLTSQRIQDTYLEATKRRTQQKPLLYGINVYNNPPSKGVNVDINTQSKEKESKEKEIKEEDKDSSSSSSSSILQSISNLYQENIGVANGVTTQNMEYAINDFKDNGATEQEAGEIVKKAIEIGALKNVHNWKFIQGVLNNWQKDSLYTLDAINAHEKSHLSSSRSDKELTYNDNLF